MRCKFEKFTLKIIVSEFVKNASVLDIIACKTAKSIKIYEYNKIAIYDRSDNLYCFIFVFSDFMFVESL